MSEPTLSEIVAQLEAERAALDSKIAETKAQAIGGAIAEVQSLMEARGVTLEMLGGRKARAPRAAAASAPKQTRSTKGARIAAKYKNQATGETWSGRGLKPNWLRAAIMQGRKIEEFAVTAGAA